MYAKWQEVHTVTFDVQGGSSVASLTTGYIASAPETTKADCGFGGWYTDSACTDENAVSFPYTVTSDITLYAKWTAVQCTITYYANGATGGTVPASVTVDKGSSYTVSANTGSLAKTGYAFTKWNTKADGTGSGYSAGSTMTVTGDVALYAQWGVDYGSWENDDLRSSMVYVTKGSFVQGTNSSHVVKMGANFYIGKYEVTYELWKEVAEWAAAQETSWNLDVGEKGGSILDASTDFEPVTNVSLYQAITWCNAYSEMNGLSPCYYSDTECTAVYRDYADAGEIHCGYNKPYGYRLPHECEWEYAAKGGSSQKSYIYSGSNMIGDVAWYSGNSNSESHPVGSKIANTLGIYDMCGNVREWCYESYYKYSTDAGNERYYISFETSTTAGTRLYQPIYRGGSWYDAATSVSARHYASYGIDKNRYTGFRIARNSE